MQPTKSTKIIYWITTGLIALFIIPGFFFAGKQFALDGTAHLGLPLWFHWELSIAKFIGGIILILPFIPKRIREWAYVGFGIDFISATIALISVDGPVGSSFFPLVMLIILIISYITFRKIYFPEG